MHVKFTYFKPSGKYYATVDGDIPGGTFWDVVALIKCRLKTKIKMPGLSGEWSGYTLAEIDGLPHLFGQYGDIREK